MTGYGEDIELIKLDYIDACNRYVAEFCRKHDFKNPDWYWVGGQIGTVLALNDYFIDFQDIRYDIDEQIPTFKYWDWYEASLKRAELGIKGEINYKSYCEGAPWRWSNVELRKIEELKEEIDKIVNK